MRMPGPPLKDRHCLTREAGACRAKDSPYGKLCRETPGLCKLASVFTLAREKCQEPPLFSCGSCVFIIAGMFVEFYDCLGS